MDILHPKESVHDPPIFSGDYGDGGLINPREEKQNIPSDSEGDEDRIFNSLEEKPIFIADSEGDEDHIIDPLEEKQTIPSDIEGDEDRIKNPPEEKLISMSDSEGDEGRIKNPPEEKLIIISDSEGDEDRIINPPEGKLIIISDSEGDEDRIESGDTGCMVESGEKNDGVRGGLPREPASRWVKGDSERISKEDRRMHRPKKEENQNYDHAGLEALDIDFLAGFTSPRFLLIFAAVFFASGCFAYASISARMEGMRPHKIASMLDREALLHIRPVCSDVDRCVEFFTEVMGGFESKGPGDDRLVIFSQVSLAPVIGDPTTAVPVDFRLGDTGIEAFIAALQDKAKEHNFSLQCAGNACTGDVVPPLHFHKIPVTYEQKWDELRRQFVARASDARGVDIDFDPFSTAIAHLDGLKQRILPSEL